ncbi:MAG: hypothetical protein ACLS7Z_10365 [Christensenellales bacterium]
MVKLKLYKRDGDEYGGDDPNSRRRESCPAREHRRAKHARRRRADGRGFPRAGGCGDQGQAGQRIVQKGDTVVDALTTAGDDASAATGELWPGLYEIVEASPPVGYEPSDAHFSWMRGVRRASPKRRS